MIKKRAFSYIRMSTEAQLKGQSLERQLELARTYARENHFELIEDLRDIGLSAHDGTNVEKGRLGTFLRAIENGEIAKDSVLLVESLDRLSRQDPMTAFTQLSKITGYGIEVHTIFDRQVYSQETIKQNAGLLFTSLGFMLRAHSESEEKSRRLKKRWESNRGRLDSRILTTVCPAWLKANDAKTGFEIIPERASTIKTIFDLCVNNGQGAYSIASYLNKNKSKFPRFTEPHIANRGERGKQTTGWQKSYITKILNNPAVYGEFQPKELVSGKRCAVGGVISDYFPAVVTKQEYLLAKARMRTRRLQGGGRKGETFNNLFTKLAFCGKCGAAVHYINKGAAPKGGQYLRCSNAILSNNCDMKGWGYAEFEETFFKFISDVNYTPVLTKGNDDSRLQKLLDDRDVCIQTIRQKQGQLDTLLEVQTGMSEFAVEKLRQKIEMVSNDLKISEDTLSNLELEIEEINARNTDKVRDKLIADIVNAQTLASHDEKVRIRRAIHSQISMVVSRIVISGLEPNDSRANREFTVLMKNGAKHSVFGCVPVNPRGRHLPNKETGEMAYEFADEVGPIISFREPSPDFDISKIPVNNEFRATVIIRPSIIGGDDVGIR